MSAPWMPLYVADYLADTAHLSAAEHGAYLLLIMHYWRAGKLPTDERQLQRIARMSTREWTNSRDTLAAFFDAEWRHKRIENEIAKSDLKSNARAEAGARGGRAKALKNNDAPLANATILPEQNNNQNDAVALASSSQSHSSSLRSEETRVEGAWPADAFDAFWRRYPHKVGKDAAQRKFDALRRKPPLPFAELMAALERYILEKPPDRQWCNPATWLNQGRWNDEPAPEPIRSASRQHRNGSVAILDEALAAARRHERPPDGAWPEVPAGCSSEGSGGSFVAQLHPSGKAGRSGGQEIDYRWPD